MKILLLFKTNPLIVNIQQNIIPNGLRYIAALLLKNNIDTEILSLSNKGWKECEGIIREKNPDIIGIGCYTFNRHTCVKLANLVKTINRDIKVIFGGPHASIMYNQLMENYGDVDVIVFNEGEITFLDVVQELNEGRSLKNIKGIAYRFDNGIINNGFREPLENLDELPIPANHFRYKRIITSRGCPGRCVFCDTPNLWGQKIRLRSAKNVVDELEILNKKYDISSFIISDDTFTFDKNRTIDICKEIIKRNLKITWDCRSRVNLVCEDRLRWMKKAGCVTISYGIESGSQKILNNLKKGITIEQIRKAAELTRRLGFNLNYFIIVGSPGETDDTIRETMKLIEETKPISTFTYVMQLTPGTGIYGLAKDQKFIYDSDWVEREDETIFYTKEKSLQELNRYVQHINEFVRILKAKFQYNEGELKKIMDNGKGVQDLINLAHIQMKSKKFDDALELINEAIILNCSSSEALMNKAVLLAMKNDSSCIDFFDKAITTDSENLIAYKNKGIFLFKQGKYDEAIDVFKMAIEVEPANIELCNHLGEIYGTKGEYDSAIKIFKKILSFSPNNKLVINNLAITFEKKRESWKGS
ncbi:MAG: radical SAM protein [Nanoarchaeota archaeon]|nr:radical SAM protein [Nanoarchaeota archaeon]